MNPSALFLNSPLILSDFYSQQTGANVWLKMDALQPSGSFKARGMGHACARYYQQGARRFIASSGGNAGLAVAYAGAQLGAEVLVIVPRTTKARAIDLIERQGAQVEVHGENWNQAHEYALSLVDEHSAYLHPFDDPLIWEGHASLIDEVVAAGLAPDTVVLSVGGGGLLRGIALGLERNGLLGTQIIAAETRGAASLAAAKSAGKRVSIDGIESIASSLGARQIAQAAFEVAQRPTTHSCVVSDTQAVQGCKTLLDEHRVLTEPACGASIAALSQSSEIALGSNVLVVVCGGVGMSVQGLMAL
ncbi:pyridoxal-phosphate dependent enzyme [Paraferrimonas sedimenticola]|uniref:L-serine ammonia-lyase n=1 Tax=Paraferrimonas sedimenticola TaxID=375674 RepID=A0AA37W0H9_9GAMM|nr:pyridoxal-phosphate dependent enzyme [Paraferrimonas sedimenticola]GLP97899.1 threonine dehydratase [Paraferrimonas sedimenticola]